MPRRPSQKCINCSELSVEEAIRLHGPGSSSPCWDEARCHRRRSHYRNRNLNNLKRRRNQADSTLTSSAQSNLEAEPTPVLKLLPKPANYSAVLVMYRHGKNKPIHAIGVELWQGNQCKAVIEPVHCQGMNARQITDYLQTKVLPLLFQNFGIEKFDDQKELPPTNCPLQPCPLKP